MYGQKCIPQVEISSIEITFANFEPLWQPSLAGIPQSAFL